jgi:hypothetical protein
MFNNARFFSVRISEVSKRTLLEVLSAVSAKKLVDADGRYLYMVDNGQDLEWVERSIRMIAGPDNYLRFDKLPVGFKPQFEFDITL